MILVPAFAAFVTAALISPVPEQRYIYNLAPLFAAAVSFLIALLERSLEGLPREGLWKAGGLLAVLALSLLLAKHQPPKYLYPIDPCDEDSYAAFDALAAEHASDPCVYLTEYSYPPTQDLGELLAFEDVLFTGDPDSPAVDDYLAARQSRECVVYIDVSKEWASGFDPEKMLPELTASTDYTDWELLYENGLSVAYLLRK